MSSGKIRLREHLEKQEQQKRKKKQVRDNFSFIPNPATVSCRAQHPFGSGRPFQEQHQEGLEGLLVVRVVVVVVALLFLKVLLRCLMIVDKAGYKFYSFV